MHRLTAYLLDVHFGSELFSKAYYRDRPIVNHQLIQ